MYNFIYYFIDNNYHCQVAFNLFCISKMYDYIFPLIIMTTISTFP
ncbi:hypothetical protein MRGR3_0219 [Staphylococcus aureus subsp. aureus MRGR3]|nr:hypothetical protein MRGR3_0219 [Staphylococcus aureus subsp. aureus MRGR3]